MSQTLLNDVANQVQTFWSPTYMDELKESTLLPGLVNKDYQGEIKKGGNTVRVSQVNRPVADMKDINAAGDHTTFDTTKLSTSHIDIVADKRIVAAYEFDDLVDLQSQIGDKDSVIRKGLLEACEIKLNEYLYSLVSPSTSAPDHVLDSVSDFNASQLNTVRKLAAQAQWMKQKGWWLLVDPSYYTDLLNAQTMTSGDYIDDAPVVGGQIATRRFGFNILEDNSPSMYQLSPTAASADLALAFHPDFMHLVMQREPTFQVSSLHSNKQFGYVISVDFIVGAKLGIEGANKHIKIYNT